MADPGRSADASLPISWDEARELLVVALLGAALMYVASPILGVFDGGAGALGDDLAEATRNVTPISGLMLLGAGVLIATTPAVDVVPRLRTAVTFVTGVVLVMGIVAITITFTRPSTGGVSSRIETVLSSSGPGLILVSMADWLARRVVPFQSPD